MKKLTGLLAVVLAFAMMGSALAEAPDMSLSYCNPLNLPNVDVASNLSEMPESSDGVLDATSINERLALDTWTVADGRSLVRSTGGFTRFSSSISAEKRSWRSRRRSPHCEPARQPRDSGCRPPPG